MRVGGSSLVAGGAPTPACDDVVAEGDADGPRRPTTAPSRSRSPASTRPPPTSTTSVEGRPSTTRPMGRTRTLPDDDADRFRIGITCCADYSAAPLGVYRALAEREVDIVLHLGDYIYEAQTADERSATAVRRDRHDPRRLPAPLRPTARAIPTCSTCTPGTRWSPSGTTTTWPTTPGGPAPRPTTPSEHGPWDDRVAAASRGQGRVAPDPVPRSRRPQPDLAVAHRRRPGRAGAARHPLRGSRPPGR